MTMGNFLKTTRIAAGLTQKELANKIGVSYQNISQYERDLRNPKNETLEKIAKALGYNFKSYTSAYALASCSVDIDDKAIIQAACNAPDPLQLSSKLQALQTIMNACSYDLGCNENGHYLIGRYGGYALHDKELFDLWNSVHDYVSFLCANLEKKKGNAEVSLWLQEDHQFNNPISETTPKKKDLNHVEK